MRKPFIKILIGILILGLILLGIIYIFKSKKQIEEAQEMPTAISEEDKNKPEGGETKEAGEETPNTASAYFAQAQASYQKKDFDSALEQIKKAANLGPTGEIYNLWANILRDKGDRESAIEKYQQAIKKDKKLIIAYLNLATLYQDEKNYDEALLVIDQGLTHNPNNQELENAKSLIEVLKIRSQE